MKTYQDLLELNGNEGLIKDFIMSAIQQHKASDEYKLASDAELYMKTQNPAIMNYQKMLITMSGEKTPDIFGANHKCASSFFKRFVTQENQYLLGNGATFGEDSTKEKLGGDDFDNRLQEAGRNALVGGVSFGFANLDHIEVFKITEFVPLWDEEDGALKAGIRFWQVADNKPLRATLYELDGYTEYIKHKDGEIEVRTPKRTYQQIVKTSKVDGTEILEGKNYPTFPIVPLWGNPEHQSELAPLKAKINCYDLIASGMGNDLDDFSAIYWTLENTGGMDDVDLAQFVERMKTIKAATVGDNANGSARAEAHTVEVPYQSREVYLTRLEKQMYKDAMALDVEQIAAGNVTATQIEAAYEPLNEKADLYEYCVRDFISGILAVLGIDDTVTFVRSKMSNIGEEIDSILKCAQHLPDEYITEKLLTILGDIDRIDEIMEMKDEDDVNRFGGGEDMDDDIGADDEADDEEETDDEGDDVINSLNKLIGEL